MIESMKLIRYQQFVPDSGAEERVADLLTLIKTEAYLATFVCWDKVLPPFEELNRILLSGSGDDGHFWMKWSPFSITEKEYAELTKEFKKSG